MFFNFIYKLLYLNYCHKNLNLFKLILKIIDGKTFSFLFKLNFLNVFFNRNYNTWNDGFLIDFSQKKSIDLWIRKTIILTNFLFSDRYLFEFITKVYNNHFISKLTHFSFFESENVISMLSQIIFYLIFTVISLFILFILFM